MSSSSSCTGTHFELRQGIDTIAAASPGDVAYAIANEYACHKMAPDAVWGELGTVPEYQQNHRSKHCWPEHQLL
jgi:hypothetical protein